MRGVAIGTMRLLGRGPARARSSSIATDVHGSERTWQKFLNAAKFYGADVLVMGGDVMGKLAIPIIREAGGTYRATDPRPGRARRDRRRAWPAVRAPDRRPRASTTSVMDEDEYRATQADPTRSSGSSCDLATERLAALDRSRRDAPGAGPGSSCYATGGNDDLTEVMATMDRPDTQAFVACEDRAVPLDDDHVMISMPYVNPTPWKTPREADEAGARRPDRGDGRRDLPTIGQRDLQLPRPAEGFDA